MVSFKDAEHPIDPSIHAEILDRLRTIEAEHDVRILYACESGSRGWGFASPDSDYDVRFLYVPRLTTYLRVKPQREEIETPISEVLDINGWELRKAFGLMLKGNATLIEWLDSPVVYVADSVFVAAVREITRNVWQPERAYHHYLHMARKHYREHVRGETVRLKGYLYVLRPLLVSLWVERGMGVPPMRLQALVDRLIDDPILLHAIEELLMIKRAANEAAQGQPIPALTAFIDAELRRLEGTKPPEQRVPHTALLDQLLCDTVLRCDHRSASVFQPI